MEEGERQALRAIAAQCLQTLALAREARHDIIAQLLDQVLREANATLVNEVPPARTLRVVRGGRD